MLLGTYEDAPIVFDRWQIADLHDYARVRVREKAPQIGASWLRAAEAVHECMMFEDSMTAFISVDQREASEKVLYAKKLFFGLPKAIQNFVPLVKDSVEEIGFGHLGRPSRILSLPNSSAVRGRRMNVVMDEADFFKDGGKDAYRAGVGRISRGGRLTVQSTCFGSGTLLDNMMTGVNDMGERDRKADPVSRARYPWPVVEQNDVLASIELARQTLDEADFAEEYECVRGSQSSDPFPVELLRQQLHDQDLAPIVDGKVMWEEMAPLIAGYDVGKGSGRHPSILSLFSEEPGGNYIQRALYQPVDAKGMPLTLPEQQKWLQEMMGRLKKLTLVPDAQGIGAQIAQALERQFGPRRVITMIPGSKPAGRPVQTREEMATEIRRLLEEQTLWLAQDLEQMKQFRRTKRDPNGRVVQLGVAKREHFDRFWASAYAAYAIAAIRGVRSPYADHGLVVVSIGGRRGVA